MGRVATGATGGALAEIVGAADTGGATTAGGGGTAGRAGGAVAAGTTGRSIGGETTGRGGTTAGGATAAGAGGITILGGGGGTIAGFGGTAAAGFSAGGGTTAGRAGGAATASFLCVMALNTSPGREMFDRSILVLISSSPRAARDAALPAGDWLSEVRKCTRTFSASCSSRELECVFFSVTPTCVSTSRMALLLTSSSRARSLIRTLLIRPFVSPCFS